MLSELSNALRMLCIDTVSHAGSGHLGMPLGMADVATVLFKDFLVFNPNDARFSARDRFILSCGHGSALLYSLLYLTGYRNWTTEDLKSFRKIDSKTPGHPEFDLENGIEISTGPLGQGIGNAVGMAIVEKKLSLINPDLSHNIYVFGSDGDFMEGISHEALSLAGTLNLDNLIFFYDDNDITIDGNMDISCTDDKKKRFESYNFFVQSIDGHNFNEISNAIKKAKIAKQPSIILCKTVIGKSVPGLEGTPEIHGKIPAKEIIENIRAKNNWTPFNVPNSILKEWRDMWTRNETAYTNTSNIKISSFQEMAVDKSFDELKENAITNDKDHPTKKSFHNIISLFQNPFLIAGSADLSESNGTKGAWMQDICKNDFKGNYINYGIREHAMCAIANGINASGNFFAYTSTFLSFSDYMRPSIRMAALMNIPSLFIFSHDSIFVGEDGPTHQPVEHIDSLNIIPNLYVFRPCDEFETILSFEYIIKSKKTSALLLTRQNLKNIHKDIDCTNIDIKNGAYTLIDFEQNLMNNKPKLILTSSGSEVEIARNIKTQLENSYNIKIVSVPCLKLLKETGRETQENLLENSTKIPTVIIEASSAEQISSTITHENKLIINVKSFGKSGKKEDLKKLFNFEESQIIEKIKKCFT